MKKSSLSGISQSIRYSKISNLADKFNDHKLSDKSYLIAREFLRLAQEEKAEDDIDYTHDFNANLIGEDEDIDKAYIDRFRSPHIEGVEEIDTSLVFGLDHKILNPDPVEETTNIFESFGPLNVERGLVNLLIKSLSIGGNNVLSSLQSLSREVKKLGLGFDENLHSMDNLRKKLTFNHAVCTALAFYYNNPVIGRAYNMVLWDIFSKSILSGNVDASTVDFIKRMNLDLEYKKQEYSNLKSEVLKKVENINQESDKQISSDDLTVDFLLYRESIKDTLPQNFEKDPFVYFNQENFEFAKSVVKEPLLQERFGLYDQILELTNCYPKELITDYLQKNNIDGIDKSSEIFNRVFKFKLLAQYADWSIKHDFVYNSNFLEKNYLFPYFSKVTSLLADLDSPDFPVYFSYNTASLIMQLFSAEEFAEKMRDENFRKNLESEFSQKQILKKIALSGLTQEQISENHLDDKTINQIKLFKEFGVEGLILAVKHSDLFGSKKMLTQQELFVDPKYVFQYIKEKYYSEGIFSDQDYISEDLPIIRVNILETANWFNYGLPIFGNDIDKYSAAAVELLIDNYDQRNKKLSTSRLQISREQLDEFIKINGNKAKSFLLNSVTPGNRFYIFTDLYDLEKTVEEVRNVTGMKYGANQGAAFMKYSLGYIDYNWLKLFKDTGNLAANHKKVPALKKVVDQGFFVGNFHDIPSDTSLDDDVFLLQSIDSDPKHSKEIPQNHHYWKVKELMAKFPGYSSLTPFTEEYNKLFFSLYTNYRLRGSNKDLILSLFDEANIGRANLTGHERFVEAYFGTNDISNISQLENKLFRSNCNALKQKFNEKYNYLGSYKVMFADEGIPFDRNAIYQFMSTEEFRNLSLDDNEINKIKEMLKSPLVRKDFNYDLFLKFIVNYFIKFYKQELAKSGVYEIGTLYNSDGALVVEDYTNNEYFSDEVLAKEFYGSSLKFPKIKHPRFLVNEFQDIVDKDNVWYPTIIIQIFGKRSYEALDKYSKIANNGLSYDVLDAKEKWDAIHDFANMLPDKSLADQTFVNLDKFFFDNFSDINQKTDFKFIFSSWSNMVKEFDKATNKFIGLVPVKELIKRHSLVDVMEMISLTSLAELVEDINPESFEFAKEYCKRYPIKNDSVSSKNKTLEEWLHLESVYLKGKVTSLPKWAKFTGNNKTKKGDNVSIRILPRNDPRGMFLGVISGCCQHPKGQAASCAIDGCVNPNSAFMSIELNNEMIGQAYLWTDNDGNVVIDSIETVGSELYYSNNIKDSLYNLLVQFSASLGEKELLYSNTKISYRLVEKIHPQRNQINYDLMDYLKTNYMYTDADRQYIIPKSN